MRRNKSNETRKKKEKKEIKQYPWIAEARIGTKWRSLFGANSSERWRWIANVGIRRIGFSKLTNLCEYDDPSFSCKITRPARVKSRSNQVCLHYELLNLFWF